VREETGLDVRLTRLVGLYSRPRLGGYHSLALFAAEVVGGELRPEPSEVIETGWFARGELPEDMLWGQVERIDDAFDGRGGSIVRTLDRERPDVWPADRAAHYAARDRSGLARREYYRRFAERLGDDASAVEVE
jgi:hypothetical protein